ncbi:uncharacterized protein BJ171DRAFT_487449 [Polychytrium aggregatum]|uniref:uncharacterized protein n=1 Tax=Polychytrium aggregatum TaxID=110093 RepID=UPI0022FE216D|nr:uncharacterized protein BJ171DRAFT_487449 [Polychytrium aggregatum]KAI9208825.1 hypothetical protein BJ171DRAFT_487449 [Polychytrium aggregatum]
MRRALLNLRWRGDTIESACMTEGERISRALLLACCFSLGTCDIGSGQIKEDAGANLWHLLLDSAQPPTRCKHSVDAELCTADHSACHPSFWLSGLSGLSDSESGRPLAWTPATVAQGPYLRRLALETELVRRGLPGDSVWRYQVARRWIQSGSEDPPVEGGLDIAKLCRIIEIGEARWEAEQRYFRSIWCTTPDRQSDDMPTKRNRLHGHWRMLTALSLLLFRR